MRCVQCDGVGHFKCRSEEESKAMKLSFAVEDNIDEFIRSTKANGLIYDDSSSETEQRESKSERKRDKKKLLKKKQKKAKKVRRLSNSNIIIPTDDEDKSDEVLSDESEMSEDSEKQTKYQNRALKKS